MIPMAYIMPGQETYYSRAVARINDIANTLTKAKINFEIIVEELLRNH